MHITNYVPVLVPCNVLNVQFYIINEMKIDFIWPGLYQEENACTKEANNGIPQQIYYIVI